MAWLREKKKKKKKDMKYMEAENECESSTWGDKKRKHFAWSIFAFWIQCISDSQHKKERKRMIIVLHNKQQFCHNEFSHQWLDTYTSFISILSFWYISKLYSGILYSVISHNSHYICTCIWAQMFTYAVICNQETQWKMTEK